MFSTIPRVLASDSSKKLGTGNKEKLLSVSIVPRIFKEITDVISSSVKLDSALPSYTVRTLKQLWIREVSSS